jgi:hypothetical protein
MSYELAFSGFGLRFELREFLTQKTAQPLTTVVVSSSSSRDIDIYVTV